VPKTTTATSTHPPTTPTRSDRHPRAAVALQDCCKELDVETSEPQSNIALSPFQLGLLAARDLRAVEGLPTPVEDLPTLRIVARILAPNGCKENTGPKSKNTGSPKATKPRSAGAS